MAQPSTAILMAAFDRLRAGDLPGAVAASDAALRREPHNPAVHAFLGLLFCQSGEPEKAVVYLREALRQWPDDVATRVNLAKTLIALDELEEAEKVCADGPGDDIRLRRLAGYIFLQRDALEQARAAYETVIAGAPHDFETWNNLGNVCSSLGDHDDAVLAFRRAIEIRPDLPQLSINLSKTLVQADRATERRQVMRDSARRLPDDAEVQLELGLAEAALEDKTAAERAFRAAIHLTDGFTPAYLELALHLENLNRIDDLAALVEEAEKRGADVAELKFVKAWLSRRQGKFGEALTLAEAAPETIAPLRRAQLIAELADRTGDPERAFAAFIEMNLRSLEEAGPAVEPTYEDEVKATARSLTAASVAAWRSVEISATAPSPVFILGFPRSGTTLLDTLLMNLPQLHVLEEKPVMRQPEVELGGPERIGMIDNAEANALRTSYFGLLDDIAPPPRPGMTIVDKFPLHMARMPLIHRLFPDSKIIMVERHPCDTVLSCFMSNFTLNRAMRHFTTLESAARLYDTVFDCWTRATELLPLNIHRIRYERMVDDLEGEMRALLGFLEIAWDASVLDNQGSAARRAHITTASYSQVTEPIYRRSAGRWARYRPQMEPVLPLLAPWAERMGYTI